MTQAWFVETHPDTTFGFATGRSANLKIIIDQNNTLIGQSSTLSVSLTHLRYSCPSVAQSQLSVGESDTLRRQSSTLVAQLLRQITGSRLASFMQVTTNNKGTSLSLLLSLLDRAVYTAWSPLPKGPSVESQSVHSSVLAPLGAMSCNLPGIFVLVPQDDHRKRGSLSGYSAR